MLIKQHEPYLEIDANQFIASLKEDDGTLHVLLQKVVFDPKLVRVGVSVRIHTKTLQMLSHFLTGELMGYNLKYDKYNDVTYLSAILLSNPFVQEVPK